MEDLLSIQTPGNAVELNIRSLDLVVAVESQEVEPLDLILTATHIWEEPVPHDLVAAVEDVEGLNA